MTDKLIPLGDGVSFKRLKDMGDGTHAEVVSVTGGVGVFISGNPAIGQTLTAVLSSGIAASSYQWKRDGVAISGATGATYAFVSADVGKSITVQALGLSSTSAPASSQPIAPSVTSAPVMIGTPTVGNPVAYTAGAYAGSPAPSTAIQWMLDAMTIVGANGATYTPISSDAGHSLSVKETATNASGSVVSQSAGVSISAAVSTAIASMAVRTKIPSSYGNVPANCYTTTRVREISNVSGVDPWGEVWNGYVDASNTTDGQETAVPNVWNVKVSLLTGTTNGSSLNQTSSTLTRATFNGAAQCLPGFAYKLDGSAPTQAEFVALGGTLSTDGFMIGIPPGWRVRWDKMAGVSVSARQQYFLHIEDSAAPQVSPTITTAGTYTAGSPVAITGTPLAGWNYSVTTVATGIIVNTKCTFSGGNLTFDKDITLAAGQVIQLNTRRPAGGVIMNGASTGLGDGSKPSSTPDAAIALKDWTGLSGVTITNGALIQHAVNLFFTVPAGTIVGGDIGDSIGNANHDINPNSTAGDSDGAAGWNARGWNAAGMSSVRCAVSGTKGSVEYAKTGNAQRKLTVRYCTHMISTMGHNDRSRPFAGNIDVGMLSLQRWYWGQYRNAALPGAKIIGCSLMPQCTGTFADQAGQTSATGATSTQYTYNNYMETGAMDIPAGDCDLAYPLNASLYGAGAVAAGFNDAAAALAAYKWPTNGTWSANSISGSTLEGTHIQYAASIWMGAAFATWLTANVQV